MKAVLCISYIYIFIMLYMLYIYICLMLYIVVYICLIVYIDGFIPSSFYRVSYHNKPTIFIFITYYHKIDGFICSHLFVLHVDPSTKMPHEKNPLEGTFGHP